MSLAKMLSAVIKRETSVFPHVEISEIERWDKEWLGYLLSENPKPHIMDHSELEFIGNADQFSNKKPVEVYTTSLCRLKNEPDRPMHLHVWISGSEIVGKNVLEIGSGCAFLGKQISPVTKSYLGIDFSRFSVNIAKATLAPNAQSLHIKQEEEIESYFGTFDTMVGREFFIHQNFEHAASVLTLGHALLKKGGLISADFCDPPPDYKGGIIHKASSDIDPTYASCGYTFTDNEVKALANQCGLTVEEITPNSTWHRKFVIFRKK